MKIITGATGEVHVTSNNDGELNQALFGTGLVVLTNGNRLNASIVDNNTINIADGDLVFQGRHALIEPGTTDAITIGTGAIDANRNDLIVARYSLDIITGYEKLTLEVLEGTETSGVASDPEYTEGNIRTGAILAEAPLYRVRIEGINIVAVEPMFEMMANSLAQINKDLSGFKFRINPDTNKPEKSIDGGETWENFSGGEGAVLLWTNPSPATAFGAQTINESSDGWVSGQSLADYDYFLIITKWHTTVDYRTINTVQKNVASVLSSVSKNSIDSGTQIGRRVVTYSNIGIAIGGGYNNTNGVDNLACIPLEIWGCKNIGVVPPDNVPTLWVTKGVNGGTTTNTMNITRDNIKIYTFGYQSAQDKIYEFPANADYYDRWNVTVSGMYGLTFTLEYTADTKSLTVTATCGAGSTGAQYFRVLVTEY